ncbi:uncharacterized protein LOC108926011 [Scleropages formosus]|uniref:uncharacterized protein LOC108926011 n=1 Tax=Scleropages formosus TaxID=113540 RepID=UPI000877EB7C|nr:uncharacterized protein LOC108926011 [Scleropages formosus]
MGVALILSCLAAMAYSSPVQVRHSPQQLLDHQIRLLQQKHASGGSCKEISGAVAPPAQTGQTAQVPRLPKSVSPVNQASPAGSQVLLPTQPNNQAWQPGIPFMVPLQPNSQTPQLAFQGPVPPQYVQMLSYGSFPYFHTQTGQQIPPVVYMYPTGGLSTGLSSEELAGKPASVMPRFGVYMPDFGGNVPAFPKASTTNQAVHPSVVAIPDQVGGLPVPGVPALGVEAAPSSPVQLAVGPDVLKQPSHQKNPQDLYAWTTAMPRDPVPNVSPSPSTAATKSQSVIYP